MSIAKRLKKNHPYQDNLKHFDGDDISVRYMPDINKVIIFTSVYCKIFELNEAIDFAHRTAISIRTRPKETAIKWVRNATMMVRVLGSVYGFQQTCSVIDKILEVCFQSEFTDSQIVVELLQILDLNMYNNVLNRYILPYVGLLLNPGRDEERSLYRCNFSSYFLQHAKRSRETFKGKWFAENCYQSVIKCVTLYDADLLKVLLQNGFCSNFSTTHRKHFKFAMRHPRFQKLCEYRKGLRRWCSQRIISNNEKELAIIQTILFHIFRVKQQESYIDIFLNDDEIDLERVHQNLPLLFRAIPVPSSRIPIDIANDSCKPDGSFGELKYQEELAPCSLKHLSRCAIRQRLAEKFLLPEGIWELDLSTIMREYLNLEKE